jgi:hypothetical protein
LVRMESGLSIHGHSRGARTGRMGDALVVTSVPDGVGPKNHDPVAGAVKKRAERISDRCDCIFAGSNPERSLLSSTRGAVGVDGKRVDDPKWIAMTESLPHSQVRGKPDQN